MSHTIQFVEKLVVEKLVGYIERHGSATRREIQQYIRSRRPALLAVWGKNDPFFLPPGAQAFKRDQPDAEIHLLDAGHFALESQGPHIAGIIRDFLVRKLTKQALAA